MTTNAINDSIECTRAHNAWVGVARANLACARTQIERGYHRCAYVYLTNALRASNRARHMRMSGYVMHAMSHVRTLINDAQIAMMIARA